MINKDFDIAHIDLINLKIKYEDLSLLKAETFPNRNLGDEAKTFIIEDKVIFACGIRMVREGVGECWVVPSVHVDKYAKSFYKEIKQLLSTYSVKMGLHRIHTTIDKQFVNWIEKLGFDRECVLRRITSDKKDEYLYTKFY